MRDPHDKNQTKRRREHLKKVSDGAFFAVDVLFDNIALCSRSVSPPGLSLHAALEL
jgi:hypothetical protein